MDIRLTKIYYQKSWVVLFRFRNPLLRHSVGFLCPTQVVVLAEAWGGTPFLSFIIKETQQWEFFVIASFNSA